MSIAGALRHLLIVTAFVFPGCAAASTPLVTGNGFEFAVVSVETGMLTKVYAHPYSFMRPDPRDPMSEGIETANFIKNLRWSAGVAKDFCVEYVEDSHVIHTRSGAGDGTFFMPFGLRRDALIVNWQAAPSARSSHLEVEWNRPVTLRRVVRMFGAEVQVLRFEGMVLDVLQPDKHGN